MPDPVRIKGVVMWDRLQLDAAFENFKTDQRSNTIHAILGIKS